jgi:hypothetical protein
MEEGRQRKLDSDKFQKRSRMQLHRRVRTKEERNQESEATLFASPPASHCPRLPTLDEQRHQLGDQVAKLLRTSG